MLDEDKPRRYLQLYDKAFLYQKTGFMLERIQAQAHISDQLNSSSASRQATVLSD